MQLPLLTDAIDVGYENKPPMLWPIYDKPDAGLDRAKFMTSSEAGGCERKIKFRQLSPQIPFAKWGFAERGNNVEDWAVNLIRSGLDDNFNLVFGGSDQVSFVHEHQSGTPDGLLVETGGEYARLVEIKSIDPRTNKKNLPKPMHVAQVMQNIDLVNKSSFPYIVKSADLIYIDASNYQDRTSFLLEYNVTQAEDLAAKSVRIAEARTPDELEPDGLYTGECKLCDFSSRCSGAAEATQRAKDEVLEQERAMKNVFK